MQARIHNQAKVSFQCEMFEIESLIHVGFEPTTFDLLYQSTSV